MKAANELLFYSRAYIYFAVAFLVIIAGFFPSYFAKLSETGASHHFHGITATLWMLILVVQPFLYKMDKMRWHRLVGRSTLILVPLLVIGGLSMVHTMLNSGSYPGLLAQQLAFIDFFVLAQFILFYVLALKNVRNTQYHARYMACTIFGPLLPALTRLLFIIPGINGFAVSLNISYILIEIVLLLLIYDDRKKGKMRLPYPLALGLIAIQHLLMNFAGNWGWWQNLMEIYAGI